MYVLQLMDHYSAGFGVLIIAIVECVAVSWMYGTMMMFTLMVMNIHKYVCRTAQLCFIRLTDRQTDR